jgi:hypothetical protein
MTERRYGSRYFLPSIILLFIFAGIIPAQQNKTATQCKTVTVKFSLKAGESVQKSIGSLTFKLQADNVNGWIISLDDANDNDFIAPVNPPLRFNPLQILGPAYGLTAKESLNRDREMNFIISNADYAHVVPLWKDALWPYSARNPDKAAENYTSALSIPLGLLRIRTVNADIFPEDLIRSARFEVEFTAPSQFRFDPSLSPRPSPCKSPH